MSEESVFSKNKVESIAETQYEAFYIPEIQSEGEEEK